MDKLSFIDFCCEVNSSPQNSFGDDYMISIERVLKNNGVQLTGITIREKTSPCSPVIYLDEIYQDYLRSGNNIDAYVSAIIRFYDRHEYDVDFDANAILDFDAIKVGLFIKMLNYDKNIGFLSTRPHRRFLDLAITYNVNLSMFSNPISSLVITNELMEEWNISEDDLFKIAIANTETILPPIVSTIGEILKDALTPLYDYAQDVPMFVISNQRFFYGASTVLYSGLLKQLSSDLADDLILLPASVHEMIAVPNRFCNDASELVQMVRSVNSTDVLETEVLSDNVYVYSSVTDEISMVEGIVL